MALVAFGLAAVGDTVAGRLADGLFALTARAGVLGGWATFFTSRGQDS